MGEITKILNDKGKLSFHELQQMLLKRGELVNQGVNDTKAEMEIAQAFLNSGIKAVPQYQIKEYRFDFKILNYPILIEIDGKVHHKTARREKDYKKDRIAQRRGFKVLRFSNAEISANKKECVQEVKDTIRTCFKQPKEVLLYKQVKEIEIIHNITITEQIKNVFRKIFKGKGDGKK